MTLLPHAVMLSNPASQRCFTARWPDAWQCMGSLMLIIFGIMSCIELVSVVSGERQPWLWTESFAYHILKWLRLDKSGMVPDMTVDSAYAGTIKFLIVGGSGFES
jgi:hypothetical protein